MITLLWLLAAFAAIALAALLLYKYTGLSRVFCCALCMAACACAVMAASVWRWMPQAYRPVMRMEALREQGGEGAADTIWLRNAFGLIGERSTPGFPKVEGEAGAWTLAEDGLRWHAGPETEGQADAIIISVPAAERYALFFWGNRHTGKVLLTYPDTGASEVIDTRRDSDAWEVVIADIGLYGAGTLGRMRRDMAFALAGCVAASALLFAALQRLLRRHRTVLGSAWRSAVLKFERRLAQSRLARAPLHPRRWSWYVFALFALLLLPLLVIAVYAHPTYDDYSYGQSTKMIWQQTGSIAAVLRAAWEWTLHIYRAYQGSFSAVFLMTLQPGIFGERVYILAPYFLMASLVAATWFFARTVIGKRYGPVLCWLALFFSVQFMPGADEAFYWFNGGIYYTFFYSLSLVLYSLVLLAHRAASPAKRAATTGGACLLALVIGGGNYVTALLSCVLLALLAGYRRIQKDGRWWIPAAALLCLACSLVVSAVAPGNALRQAESQAMPYPEAILASFPHAFTFLLRGMRAEALLGAGGMRLEFVLGAVVALPFVQRAAEGSKCAFRYPGLVTAASLCVYACQFTPHLAALSREGPARMMNIIFFTNLWLLGGNMFYWCGWLAKRRRAQGRHVKETGRVLARWAAVGAAAMLLAACAVTAVREPNAISGVSAAANLMDGRARRYGEALADRIAVFEDEDVRDAVVPPLPPKPHVLKYTEMVADPTDWMNRITAAYYGKESVSVEW